MNSTRRRAVFERARDRAISFGMPMESNPLFIRWVEEWIAGEITVDELKARYASLLDQRLGERRLEMIARAPSEHTGFSKHKENENGNSDEDAGSGDIPQFNRAQWRKQLPRNPDPESLSALAAPVLRD